MFTCSVPALSPFGQEEPDQSKALKGIETAGRPVALKRAAVVLSPLSGGIEIPLLNPQTDQVEEDAPASQRRRAVLADDLLVVLHQLRCFLTPSLRLPDARQEDRPYR